MAGSKRIVVCVGFFFILGASMISALEPPVQLISPRDSALGGRHVANSDSFSSLMNNPAGFYGAREEVSFAEITLGVKGPVFSLADAILQGDSTDLSNLGELINGIYAGLDLLGPLSFGYIGNGLGLGIYNQGSVRLWSNNSLTANVKVWDDVLLTGGYGYRLPFSGDVHALDAGILLKGGFRGTVNGAVTVLDLQNLDVGTLIDQPFTFTSFIGFDLGLRYSIGESWVVGLVGRDVYTPTFLKDYNNINDFFDGVGGVESYDKMPFQLDAGMMYSPSADMSRYSISDIKLFLDYSDVFDFLIYPEMAVNPILNIGIGSEITLMEILDLRIGMSQGLLAAGIGLDLHFFDMNLAMFGTERSTEPGLAPVYNLQLSFEFRG